MSTWCIAEWHFRMCCDWQANGKILEICVYFNGNSMENKNVLIRLFRTLERRIIDWLAYLLQLRRQTKDKNGIFEHFVEGKNCNFHKNVLSYFTHFILKMKIQPFNVHKWIKAIYMEAMGSWLNIDHEDRAIHKYARQKNPLQAFGKKRDQTDKSLNNSMCVRANYHQSVSCCGRGNIFCRLRTICLVTEYQNQLA